MFYYQNSMLSQKVCGINFENPVGLAAGFDKNAELISIMEDVGFGFVECGSVSAKACAGNSGKRLRREIKEGGLWVNLGLNNYGAEEIATRILGKRYKIPFGVSIARTNCKETAEDSVGIKDYLDSARAFEDIGNFFVINISCPNAFGGQPFSDARRFESLMKEYSKLKVRKPTLIKMSPDLTHLQIDKIISISQKYEVSGFICSNLTKKGIVGSGGYSGKIVEEKSNDLLSYIYQRTKGKKILIGVGGVFSAEDAYKKIRLGANLVELVTGMIFVGPQLIGEINIGLTKMLARDGFRNISEAVGADNKILDKKRTK
jgi:dihydroorotate dehydrogenase subfamily 2